ncbi:MAG: hypothetical protein ABEJ95_01185 [Candidatus Nanohalobium sp.]
MELIILYTEKNFCFRYPFFFPDFLVFCLLKGDIRLSVARFDLNSNPEEWSKKDYRELIQGRLEDGLDWTNPDYFPLDPENDYSFALVLYDREHPQPRRGEIFRTDSVEIPDNYMAENSLQM